MADLSKLPPNPAGSPTFPSDARATDALRFRFGAALSATLTDAPHPTSVDLTRWHDYSDLFSKTLKQDHPGIVNKASFKAFIAACGFPDTHAQGTADFEAPTIQLGSTAIPWGQLNGPQGAFALQPIGDDSQAFTVAAPPAVDTPAYAVELIELYWASLLRDRPFTLFDDSELAQAASAELTKHVAHYAGPTKGGVVTPDVLFRGAFRGELAGPYISQLCITPTMLGAQSIDQLVQTYGAGKDFMLDPDEWFAIQNGAAPSDAVTPDPKPRFLHNGRGLAAFTHIDELYQAYLVAYLVLETWKVDANPGSPYRAKLAAGYKKQKPFGTFGGPDIAATLGAVAKAALDAVWYQKWIVHLRHRPEASGGLVYLRKTNASHMPLAATALHPFILDSHAVERSFHQNHSYLLGQTFPEGSPTHPAYPTGHGTVAGACMTALKFFYDCEQPVQTFAKPMVPTADGLSRVAYTGADASSMTISGELHKLAHNISFGHGIHAGIHWRSDTDASIRLGEAVALKFLHDRAWAYKEQFSITINTIDDLLVEIKNF